MAQFFWMNKEDSLLLDVFKDLDPNLKNSVFGRKFSEERLANIAGFRLIRVGNVMPVFSVGQPDGNQFSNSSLTGRPYLVVFSATWCVPCIKMQPQIQALYQKYARVGIKVVYFNLDDDRKKWLSNISSKTSQWINVSEMTKFKDSKIAKRFAFSSIPSLVLVDSAGRIAYNAMDVNPDFKILDELLGKSGTL